MKFTTVVVDGGSGDVDSIMNCWSSDQHYAVVDSSGEVALTSSSSDELKLLDPVAEGKATMDVLDSLLSGTQVGNNNSFAELKPLPPFITSYTGQVRLNDIRLNEFYAPSPQSQQQQQIPSPNSGVVGSSNRLETNNNNSNVNNNNNVYKNCSVSTSGNELYYMTEPVTSTVDGLVTKHDDVILGSIADSEMDDFAAIIGNVMADTTVHNAGLDSVADVINRDAWMDFDLIDTCTAKDADYLHEMANHFVNDCSPSPPSSNPSVVSPPSSSQQQQASSSTLQSLLTQGTPPANYQAINSSNIKREPATYHHMPLLQSRLQNGANGNSMMNNKDPQQQQQQQQFLPYCNGGAGGGKDMLPHTTLASPPGHVTTSELVNGGPSPPRFNSGAPSRNNNAKFRPANNRGELSSLDGYGGGSMSTPPAKKSKSRSKNKLNAQNSGNSGAAAAGLATYPDGSAKEKPVHHCSICNRGFLNKSNIKVHLRTHTGEKPFRCEVCGKAFRQKAHLIKHQQIHKRVGRD